MLVRGDGQEALQPGEKTRLILSCPSAGLLAHDGTWRLPADWDMPIRGKRFLRRMHRRKPATERARCPDPAAGLSDFGDQRADKKSFIRSFFTFTSNSTNIIAILFPFAHGSVLAIKHAFVYRAVPLAGMKKVDVSTPSSSSSLTFLSMPPA